MRGLQEESVNVVAMDANDLLKLVCGNLFSSGRKSHPRGSEITEVVNAHLTLLDPRRRLITLPSRNLSTRYLVGELCFYLSGSSELSFISHYSRFWNRISDDGKTVNSAYGKWLFLEPSGVSYAEDCLRQDKDSRKAVATIYEGRSHSVESRDNPCTMYLQFLIRDDQLTLMTSMRSNDIWLGLCYDLPFFTLLQEIVYVRLRRTYPKLRLGSYHHNAGSLHVYERDYEAARAVLQDPQDHEGCLLPQLTTTDVDDWFRDLLSWEHNSRTRNAAALVLGATPFQTWAIDCLRGGMS